MRKGLALACLAAAFAASANPGPILPDATVEPTDELFPRSGRLEPSVAFWTQIFGQYSEYQSVIHSQDEAHKIYTVLDFRDDVVRLGPAAARRLQQKTEAAVKRELDRHLRRIHANRANPDVLSPVERRVYELLADGTNPNRYKKAIGRFRAQRGLKEATERALRVSGRYLPRMEQIFADAGLPLTLTRLPLVESSFNVEAYSKVGAAGLWQFIPSSARIYMRLDEAVDDRRDPWTSTKAAARHLQEDYAELGSWPLAITAYNHGRGGLVRGLREVKGSTLEDLLERWDGPRFGFASRNFYAEFLAAVDVERNHREHFGEIERHEPIEFEIVQIQHYVPYDALRRISGLTESEFRTLNPGFRPEVLDGRLHVPPQSSIRVPVGKGEPFLAAYMALDDAERYEQQRFYYVRYRVQKGDTLSTIARRYGVGVSTLKQANGLGARNFIRAGQQLRIPPRSGGRNIQVAVTEKAPSSAVGGVTYLMHQVRPGQTLTSIARQYRTTIASLRELNGLAESTPLLAGATLKVPSY